MKYTQVKHILIFLPFCILGSCNSNTKHASFFSSVDIKPILKDSISVRAIEVRRDTLFYAGNRGKFGYINLNKPEDMVQWQISYEGRHPEFRSVASTDDADFLMSISHPALLYRVNAEGMRQLEYIEKDSLAFYDAMAFWNNQEGLVMGDPVDSSISILITRDGGDSWHKVSEYLLPKAAEQEAAFAASNTNIAIVGQKVWLITGGTKSRVYFSPDKGHSWEVYATPMIQGRPTTGGYAIDFYNDKIGIIVGGDYTHKRKNERTKALTLDGGKTWELLAVGGPPGYKSGVQFVPHSNGKEIVAIGPTGISYTHDQGHNWKKLAEEGFYTLRFVNDTLAYAAGKGKIARLIFR